MPLGGGGSVPDFNIKNESHQTKEFVLYFPRFITTLLFCFDLA
jgi:hypothetical protein